jgi:hypothetical protein
MLFAWELRKPFMGIGSISGTHDTYTAAVEGIRRLVVGGMCIGYHGGEQGTFKPKWLDFRRLTIIEDYDEAGVEGKLHRLVDQFRAFFKKHGRRIATVQQRYTFPPDRPMVDGVSMETKLPVPEKVHVTMELE